MIHLLRRCPLTGQGMNDASMLYCPAYCGTGIREIGQSLPPCSSHMGDCSCCVDCPLILIPGFCYLGILYFMLFYFSGEGGWRWLAAAAAARGTSCCRCRQLQPSSSNPGAEKEISDDSPQPISGGGKGAHRWLWLAVLAGLGAVPIPSPIGCIRTLQQLYSSGPC